MPNSYDCRRCGACCCNTPDNQDEGFVDYVEVEARDTLLRCADLVRRFVVGADEGKPHLRLDASGRCLALRGAVGRKVSCAIYHHRPSPCRRVEAGSSLCQRYRSARKL